MRDGVVEFAWQSGPLPHPDSLSLTLLRADEESHGGAEGYWEQQEPGAEQVLRRSDDVERRTHHPNGSSAESVGSRAAEASTS
jgi:hypothetical protein